ncbi:MAG: HAD-IA family hydrolase, partial [Acidobacteria bacterium]|nr:HAD-IA family hydrolase [Acidobacteriota bacterium]
RAAKPDSRIFLEACVRAGTRPELAWHVGDSFAEDYQGARRAGLRAVLLDRDRRYPRFPGVRVERLSQIFSLPEF